MRITNNQNLPQPLVEAVRNDGYSKGAADFSVTELLQPPQKVQLERRYDDQLTEDAADRIWSLIGQVAHGILERAGDDIEAIREQRLSMPLKGHTISGAMDRLVLVHEDGRKKLQDYKVTTAFAVKIEGGAKQEWVEQLNLYRLLLEYHGHHIDDLEIVAIYRDWSKLEAQRSPQEYPQHQVQRLHVTKWPIIDAYNYALRLLNRHIQAAGEPDDNLPACSDEERWAKPGQVAVYKVGKKRAARVVSTVDEAIDWMRWRGIISGNEPVKQHVAFRKGEPCFGHYLEFRPPRYVRCENYCAAAPVCPQWKQVQQELEDAA